MLFRPCEQGHTAVRVVAVQSSSILEFRPVSFLIACFVCVWQRRKMRPVHHRADRPGYCGDLVYVYGLRKGEQGRSCMHAKVWPPLLTCPPCSPPTFGRCKYAPRTANLNFWLWQVISSPRVTLDVVCRKEAGLFELSSLSGECTHATPPPVARVPGWRYRSPAPPPL